MRNNWEWVPVAPDEPPIFTSISDEETKVLGEMGKDKDCLEIGSAFGYSAIILARYGARSVLAVDPHLPHPDNNSEETYDGMLKNVARFDPAGVITILREPSQQACPALAAQGRRFGLIFIDADHSYESVMHDVKWAQELVAEDGLIACHDYGRLPDVTMALDEIFPEGPDHLTETLHVHG